MNIIFIIIASAIILMAFLNLVHLILKYRENKRTEQIYFMLIFVVFIISGINQIIREISGNYNSEINLTIAIGIAFFILASGISLVSKPKLAKFIAFLGIFVCLFYYIGISLNLFEEANIDQYITISIFIVMAVTTSTTDIILLYFLVKTRLSSVLGLFLGILIPTILGPFQIVLHIIPESVMKLSYLVINIILYLGFKGKLNFFEISEEEKRNRGLPIQNKEN